MRINKKKINKTKSAFYKQKKSGCLLSETPLMMIPDTAIPQRNLKMQYTVYDGERALLHPSMASCRYDQIRTDRRPNLKKTHGSVMMKDDEEKHQFPAFMAVSVTCLTGHHRWWLLLKLHPCRLSESSASEDSENTPDPTKRKKWWESAWRI